VKSRTRLFASGFSLSEFPDHPDIPRLAFAITTSIQGRSSVNAIRTTLFIAFSLLAVTQTALADDASKLDIMAGSQAPGKYSQGFAGHVSLGYTATTGSSDTSNLGAKLGLSYGKGKWYHVFSAEEIHATDSGNTTAQSTTADAQSDYLFTPNDYVFGHLSYSHDQFSGVERRTSETAGYGRRLLHTDTQTWSAQIGAGARQERLQDDTSRSSPIVQAATDYSLQLSENTSIGEAIVAEWGTDNTRLQSATNLKVKMVKNLALVLSYVVKHNTNVPDDTAATNTYTMVSVDYGF
jgi:putative salt-induced outer membrane protein